MAGYGVHVSMLSFGRTGSGTNFWRQHPHYAMPRAAAIAKAALGEKRYDDNEVGLRAKVV